MKVAAMQHISAFRCGLSSCRSAHLYLLKPWCISSSSHRSAVCCSTLAHPVFTTFATSSGTFPSFLIMIMMIFLFAKTLFQG